MQKTFVYHENSSGKDLFRMRTDTYAFNEELMIFAIADAPLRALTRQKMDYPFEDWSAMAADLFCSAFVDSATEFIQRNESYSLDQLQKDLSEANNAIKDLNEDLGKKYGDPAHYDIAETVGMVAVVNNGKLYYGGLEDAYINLLDGETLADKHKFDYQIMKAKKYLDKLAEGNGLQQYIDPAIDLPDKYKWEPAWASYLRNNTKAMDDAGNFVGFGMFTGEPDALELMQVHEIEAKTGDHLLLFTNSMIKALNNEYFMNWFIANVNTSYEFQGQMQEKLAKVNEGASIENSEKLLIHIKL
jgi:hypothetical protein